MSEPVRLAFPWVLLCSDNERHTAGGGKARAHSQAYRDSRDLLNVSGMVQVQNARLKRPVFPKAEVFLRLRYFAPDARRRDDANTLKVIKDALEGVLWTNDAQVTEWHGSRDGVDRARPRVELEVTARAR